jgi:tRNA threonylcarbamoyladenosine biosynthesis protein TsaB
LLAIDTSSVACSVALHIGTSAFERHEEKAREHTRILTPMIREVFMVPA